MAEELGVHYVVEGSVCKNGGRVRNSAQLNDVVTGRHLWAELYDREPTDVFAVQGEQAAAPPERALRRCGDPRNRLLKRRYARDGVRPRALQGTLGERLATAGD